MGVGRFTKTGKTVLYIIIILGNKPKAAAALSDEEIQKLYTENILGATTPKSLLNTIWLNNSLHFGLRGTREQYNLRLVKL